MDPSVRGRSLSRVMDVFVPESSLLRVSYGRVAPMPALCASVSKNTGHSSAT